MMVLLVSQLGYMESKKKPHVHANIKTSILGFSVVYINMFILCMFTAQTQMFALRYYSSRKRFSRT